MGVSESNGSANGSRGGAPRFNMNAAKSGARSMILRAPLGRLPKRWKRVTTDLLKMREVLEAAIIRRHGGISETKALLLQTALRAEQCCRCCQFQMRAAEVSGTLDTTAATALLKLQTEASRRRDEAVAKLDLDSEPEKFTDPWLLPPSSGEPSPADSQEDAA